METYQSIHKYIYKWICICQKVLFIIVTRIVATITIIVIAITIIVIIITIIVIIEITMIIITYFFKYPLVINRGHCNFLPFFNGRNGTMGPSSIHFRIFEPTFARSSADVHEMTDCIRAVSWISWTAMGPWDHRRENMGESTGTLMRLIRQEW